MIHVDFKTQDCFILILILVAIKLTSNLLLMFMSNGFKFALIFFFHDF